ncbi:MAG: hydrogenase 4 subunit F [Ignavibacteriales bacterium]|nr:hydrogenase 4 subunit F [Ignavibacteriales bacterium]
MSMILFSLLLGTPIAGSILCALFHKRRVLEIITVTSSGLTFLSAFWLAAKVMQETTLHSPQGWWYADGLSAYIIIIVSGSAFVVALYSIGYLRRQIYKRKVDAPKLWLYYLLLNIFLFTMMLVLLSNNLGFLWIGSEATTLATAFLVAFYERESSIEAAWKYVVICSVGITLALFGIILTYFSALHVVPASGNALHWSSLMLVAKELDPAVLKLAFIFILIGFGTKAGLAPMHTWKPDAYGEAPAPISALMAAGLVNVALYSLMRFYILVDKAVGGGFASTLFIIFGLMSMGVAVPFILLQRDFKRLLAYSSVEHVGIIVFALGIGTPLAYFGALLHLLNNAIAKILLFLTAGNVRMAYGSRIMHKVTGAIKVIPASATLLIVGVFAITGWPPFGIFVSEFTIVSAGFTSGNIVPAILFIGFITTIFVGFIYYTSRMVLGEPHRPVKGSDADSASLLLLGLLLGALLMLGVFIPSQLQQCIQNAVNVLKG